MPAWAFTLLKIAASLAFSALQKAGLVNAAEAWAVKTGIKVIENVESLETYPEYPTGKNGGTSNR